MKLSLLLAMARQIESKGDEGTKVTGTTGPLNRLNLMSASSLGL